MRNSSGNNEWRLTSPVLYFQRKVYVYKRYNPRYNRKTVGKIIETLKNVNIINEIIVVNDGSEDKTAQIAREHKVTVIELAKTWGKVLQLKQIGSEQGCDLLFLDADLIG